MSESRQKILYQEIIERFNKDLIGRTSPLLYSFQAGEFPAPINGVSGKPYTGPNYLLLGSLNSDPRWFTKKQAFESGYQLQDNALGRKAIYWEFKKTRPVYDERGQAVVDKNGHAVTETVQRDRPGMKIYTVYPASELRLENGQELSAYQRQTKIFNLSRLTNIINGSGVKVEHDQRNISFYRSSDDSIHIMPQDACSNNEIYASELLKMLIRASRHKKRLNRPCGPLGTEGYAREELRVALSHMMLAQDLNLPFFPDKNESYIKAWSKIVQKDPFELARASRDAKDIKEYVMSLEQSREKEAGQEIPDPLYTITAFRRVGTADGDQSRPWMEAEDDSKALFFGVQSNKDGSIAATYSVNELRYAEEKMSSLNRASSMNYAPPAPLTSTEKIYLNVHFMHKDIARALGATWDIDQKSWCARPGADLDKLSRWIPVEERMKISGFIQDLGDVKPEIAAKDTFLNVPFAEKEAAKVMGAKWNSEDKLWYAPAGTDLNKVAKWIPEKKLTPAQNLSPVDEFIQALSQAGLKLNGLPVMDGKIHRVQVEGGKAGSLDGAYSAHLDGRPNGWIQNYKTGEKTKWLSTGQALTEDQKTALKLEAAEKTVQRKLERQKMAEHAMAQAREKWNKAMIPNFEGHPYLKSKGLDDLAVTGLREDEQGNLLIPLRDANQKLCSIQTITPKGAKKFEKGCPKAGGMHIIGSDRENGSIRDIKSPKIYISEGYATGATIYLATKIPVVMAFDAGNLKAVATAIREIHPEADITICADNDHKTEKNTGLEKAQAAAKTIGGYVVCPEFTEDEKSQGMTDFNDLYQSRGLGAIREVFQQHRRSLGATAATKTRTAASSIKKGAGMGL